MIIDVVAEDYGWKKITITFFKFLSSFSQRGPEYLCKFYDFKRMKFTVYRVKYLPITVYSIN